MDEVRRGSEEGDQSAHHLLTSNLKIEATCYSETPAYNLASLPKETSLRIGREENVWDWKKQYCEEVPNYQKGGHVLVAYIGDEWKAYKYLIGNTEGKTA
jgi:hypothetical protein